MAAASRKEPSATERSLRDCGGGVGVGCSAVVSGGVG